MDRPFVGLANYVKLLDDPLFWRVVRNTTIFVVGNVVLQCLGGLALALYFAQRFPGAGWLRGLILAGWMLPPLVIGAVWKWMLTSDNGVLNFVLQSLGIVSGKIYWLSDPAMSLLSVTLANVWFGLPFNMILIAAGLAGIPHDILEAAALDGAGAVRRFFSITLPLLAPTLYALVALTTVYTMRAFDLIWTMTHGGPVDSSNIFPVWSYRLSFEVFDFGAGAAISTAMLVIVFLVALAYVRSVRSEARG
jgi:multiple sugar transport system permease protein